MIMIIIMIIITTRPSDSQQKKNSWIVDFAIPAERKQKER